MISMVNVIEVIRYYYDDQFWQIMIFFYCDAHGHGHDDYDDSMCNENHNHD